MFREHYESSLKLNDSKEFDAVSKRLEFREHSGNEVQCLCRHRQAYTKDAEITVQDKGPPTIDCPGDVYLMADYNKAAAALRWTEPGAWENSGGEGGGAASDCAGGL
jgi:hypothetical protein